MRSDDLSRTRDFKSTTTLLDRLTEHDRQAWGQLVELYGPLIYFWCRRSGIDQRVSSELLETVCHDLAVGVGSGEHIRPGGSLLGWLRTATEKRIHDHDAARDQSAEAGTEINVQSTQIARELPSGEALDERVYIVHQALRLARASFPEHYWPIIERYVIEQQDADVVANDIGVTVHVVHQVRSRYLKAVRELLSDELSDQPSV